MPGSFPDAARRPFGIRTVLVGSDLCRVSQHELETLDYAVLTQFSREPSPLDCPGQALVVAPMAGGFPMLLRELVIGLLVHLPHVAITEWPNARHVSLQHGQFGLIENVRHTIAMIERCGTDVHLFGVCQGAVAALAATAALSAAAGRAPRSLTLVGGPITPQANPTRIVRVARAKPVDWFASLLKPVPAGTAGEGRLTYPASLLMWASAAYAWRHILNRGELFWKFSHDDGDDPENFSFARLYFSLMDIPGEHFLDSIRHLSQRQDVFRGGLRIGSCIIDPRAIAHTALMTIEGASDDIAAPGQTVSAHSLCSSVPLRKREHLVVEGSGHFSLFHGSIMRSQVLPRISEFLRITI